MKTKSDILKQNGSFNENSESVKAEEFQKGVFFDPEDLIQVKYEMLRSVANKECTVKEASYKYGLSRQTYYLTKDAFDESGFSALFRKKTGPRGASKLNEEGQKFIEQYLVEHPDASGSEINRALAADLNIDVNVRTVERYLSKKITGGC